MNPAYQQNPAVYPQYPQFGATQQRLAQMEQMYPQFSPAMAQISGASQNVTWIPVSGIQGAKDHIVQPGMTAWLLDNNDTVFYVKSSDHLGVTNLKVFRFQEITPEQTQAPIAIDPSQYVQRAEFEDLKAQMEKLTGAMQKQPAKADKEV